jgi:hypothetical protein
MVLGRRSFVLPANRPRHGSPLGGVWRRQGGRRAFSHSALDHRARHRPQMPDLSPPSGDRPRPGTARQRSGSRARELGAVRARGKYRTAAARGELLTHDQRLCGVEIKAPLMLVETAHYGSGPWRSTDPLIDRVPALPGRNAWIRPLTGNCSHVRSGDSKSVVPCSFELATESKSAAPNSRSVSGPRTRAASRPTRLGDTGSVPGRRVRAAPSLGHSSLISLGHSF